MPVMLFQWKFIAVPVPAQDLQPCTDRRDSHFRRVRLGHRGQEIQQQFVLLFLLPGQNPCQVGVQGALNNERHGAFHHGSLEEEHSLNIRMLDDGDLGLGGVLAGQPPSLGPLLGVFQGGVIGGRGDGRRPQAYVDPGLVHHLEHIHEPFMRFSHQVAPAVVVLPHAQLRDGGPPVAQLVVDPGRVDVIGYQLAIFQSLLGNNKQRDSLHPRGGAFDLGQHEMNHVVHPVVVSGGDEDLLALHPVIPLIRGFRGGGDICQGASGLRLGHGHSPLPFSGEHFGNKAFDHLRGAEGQDEVCGSGGEKRVNAGRIIGRAEDEPDGPRDHERKLLAPQVKSEGRADPAAFAAFLHQPPDHGVDLHPAVYELGRILVHLRELGLHQILADFHGRVQGHVKAFPAVLGVVGVLGDLLRIKDLVEQEPQVPFTHKLVGHFQLLLLFHHRDTEDTEFKEKKEME